MLSMVLQFDAPSPARAARWLVSRGGQACSSAILGALAAPPLPRTIPSEQERYPRIALAAKGVALLAE